MPQDRSNAVAVVRLREDVLADLERKVMQPCPTIPKTEIEAGFALGVQHVIRALRTGYMAP